MIGSYSMIDPVYMQANELKTKLQCAFFFSPLTRCRWIGIMFG